MTERIAQKPPVRELLQDHVRGRVEAIGAAYRGERGQHGVSKARGQMAALRGAVGRGVGASPDAYLLEFDGAPERLIGQSDQPARAELAVHVALSLFALHQQSRNEPMHERGKTLGRAVRSLAGARAEDGRESAIMRRYAALITSNDGDELARHLRGLIGQLRAARVPLDYGALAVDLYDFQFAEARAGVRRRWSRDVLRTRTPNKPDSEPEANEPSDPVDGSASFGHFELLDL